LASYSLGPDGSDAVLLLYPASHSGGHIAVSSRITRTNSRPTDAIPEDLKKRPDQFAVEFDGADTFAISLAVAF
jgi:hypothetical protein